MSAMKPNPAVRHDSTSNTVCSKIDPIIGAWFKKYRELYEWPPGTGRKKSEQKISDLLYSVFLSIHENNAGKFASSLVEIHLWKTKNRGNQSLRYCKNLHFLGEGYLHEIIELGPFDKTKKMEALINKLNVENCNLPICSAMASFIFCRKNVPILDRFLAQFFARKFDVDKVDDKTAHVLEYVKTIPFRLEEDGTGNLRLSVYTRIGFDYNLSKYINDFLLECDRIAQNLRQSEVQYCDIQEKLVDFYPIDVEMAIFSYMQKTA